MSAELTGYRRRIAACEWTMHFNHVVSPCSVIVSAVLGRDKAGTFKVGRQGTPAPRGLTR